MKGYVKIDVVSANKVVDNYKKRYNESKEVYNAKYDSWLQERTPVFLWFTQTNSEKYGSFRIEVFTTKHPEASLFVYETQFDDYKALKNLCSCCKDGSILINNELAGFIGEWSDGFE